MSDSLAINESNLLGQYLYAEWIKDRTRTLRWWSTRWGVPLPLVEHWVRGTRRIGREHAVVFSDFPFSQQDYYSTAWDVFFGTPPDLPSDFVGFTGVARQTSMGAAIVPIRRSVDARPAFDFLMRSAVSTQETDSVEQEIKAALRDRGSLTKAEIVEAWGLSEDGYRELHQKIANQRGFESGPRKVGGLIAKWARPRTEEEADTPVVDLEPWAKTAAERLETLLSQSELSNLVGDLESGIRNARRIETGEDRPSRKSELATALLLKHGLDLFADSEVRKSVAKALKLKSQNGGIRVREVRHSSSRRLAFLPNLRDFCLRKACLTWSTSKEDSSSHHSSSFRKKCKRAYSRPCRILLGADASSRFRQAVERRASQWRASSTGCSIVTIIRSSARSVVR